MWDVGYVNKMLNSLKFGKIVIWSLYTYWYLFDMEPNRYMGIGIDLI